MSVVQVTLGMVRDRTTQVRFTVELEGTLTDPGEMVTTGRGTGGTGRKFEKRKRE